ncbi:MAG: ATP-binding protein [Desulfatibacillaceae bacterium]|nr:ATP-binding protein [Desulfatibacillaceae bacterium]
MKIAVASGKGGTGKTTVATSLAWVLAQNGLSVRYLDCDVEQPNAHFFLKPEFENTQPVYAPVPKVDEQLCTGCGECGKLCRFSAILCLGSTVMTFPEMCHGCNGCALVCEPGAISYTGRLLGEIETGAGLGGVAFVQGTLRIGEAMAPPLIRAVRKNTADEQITLLDAPPGTSCPVVTTMEGCDFVVLVTEPTPFGLHDLSLAVETVRAINLPMGIVINRMGIGDDRVNRYAAQEGIEILAQIPDSRQVAQAYSRGELMVAGIDDWPPIFESLYANIQKILAARSKEPTP